MGSTIGTLGRRFLRGLNTALPASLPGVKILGYHLVGARTGSPVDIPADAFDGQLREMTRVARIVSLDRAIEVLAAGRTPDHPLVVLTFDDAFRNFFDVAWPMLEARDLPATVYVPVGFIAGANSSPLSGAGDLPPMTWEQILELAGTEQVTIGSHSLSHPDLRGLTAQECQRELEESRKILEDRTGTAVGGFCYPRALSSPAVRALAAEVYDSAVAAGGRTNRPGNFDLHRLSRVPLRHDMPASLRGVIEKPVWLEEWIASHLRGLSPAGGPR